MIGWTMLAATLLGGAPGFAAEEPINRTPVHVATPLTVVTPEARIRNMADYLEAVADPQRGVYIRGYTGQWYYARVRGNCPRLTRGASLRFNASPGGDFDRHSSIRADGWRCMVASVIQSDGPPRR
ncbi:MAG TPA: hypothetical protein VEX35_03230 [Allosphingosinicella sp.]|nr:hypothetical protein [Allosphingosinicella sp.]